MRDTIKDSEYFEKFILEDTERVNKFIIKLKNNEVKEDRILPVKTKIHDLKLGIMIAHYSKGEDIEKLNGEYLKLIEDWEEIWIPEYYIKTLWMISIGVLLKVDDSILAKIKSMLYRSDINEWLYNFLLNTSNNNPEEIKGDLLFPEVYGELKKLVFSKKEQDKLLKDYIVNKWYEKHSSCGWYDSHRSKQNVYYGYWSFEAGAVAKILSISDDDLKGVQYYPYDLVHYGMARVN